MIVYLFSLEGASIFLAGLLAGLLPGHGGGGAGPWLVSVRRQVRRRTAALSKEQENLHAIIQSIPEPLIELSATGEILAIHSAQRGIFHLPENPAGRSHLADVLCSASAAAMMKALEAAETPAGGSSPRRQIEVAGPDGSDWFELSIARREPLSRDASRYLMLCREITEHKRDEARILRLSRLYATLSASNKVVAGARDADAMLGEICRLAVTSGEMRQAWAGMIEPDTRLIRPVAWFGDDSGYLEGLAISLDPDDPKGQAGAFRGRP